MITLESVSVSVTEEAKSVSAVNNCEITINSYGACVYKGLPNGQEQPATGLSGLDVGSSTPLNLDLTNLDKQSALALCGKQVFTLKLTPNPITTYSLLTEGNGEWKEEDATINSIDVLGYEEPKRVNENIIYLGTDQQEHTVTATANDGYKWVETSYISSTKTYIATFDWKYTVQYAVCIYDIDGDDDNGPQTITFGPATDSSYDNAIGEATQIEDDWDTIKDNATQGKAHEKYDTALNEGYIKIIDIKLNETIANTESWPCSLNVCSTLHDTIKLSYRKWNDNYINYNLIAKLSARLVHLVYQ